MIRLRKKILLIATSLAAGPLFANALAQNAGTPVPTFGELRAPIETGANTLPSQLAPGNLGLKPNSGSVRSGIDLPFGMNYSRETKSLMMPLDQKNEWGVGLNLNLNSAPGLEQSATPGLGLQPKRTPGIMLQKKF